MSNKLSHILEIIVVFVLTVLATVLLRMYVLNNDVLLPQAASLQAWNPSAPSESIDWLFSVQWSLVAFFFSLIVVFMLYSLVRSAIKYGNQPDEEGSGEYFEGNTPLEIFWTAVPLIIVLILAYLGANTLAGVERRDVQALEVNIIASQWNWQFEYPEYGVTSADLVLPVDRQVVLNMRSEDVIHSFWVPEFRVKQDILPAANFDSDYARVLRVTPTEQGEFKLRCAELCGTQHYAMLAGVSVVSSKDFDSWVLESTGCDLSDAECGQRWATEYGCVACHSVDGTQIVGPTWLGLSGSGVTLADGSTVTADIEYLKTSILDPNAQLHEGFNPDIMPSNFSDRLSAEQIEQIIAFIQSVGE